MYLDYSKLEFDANGLPETPQLVLKTLGDKMVGIIPGVHNLKLNIKFSEPSEISFDIPAVIDGEPNPLYDDVTGYLFVSMRLTPGESLTMVRQQLLPKVLEAVRAALATGTILKPAPETGTGAAMFKKGVHYPFPQESGTNSSSV